MEIWKDIENYKGHYQISNLGNVKSLSRKIPYKGRLDKNRMLKEKILLKDIRNGYYSVVLRINNANIHKNIHRLVAEAFIPNPLGLSQVNHKNGNKKICNVENLEWCTQSENTIHAYNNGLIPIGEERTNFKLNNMQINEIKIKYIPYKYSMRKLAIEYNVCVATIHETLSNKIHKLTT